MFARIVDLAVKNKTGSGPWQKHGKHAQIVVPEAFKTSKFNPRKLEERPAIRYIEYLVYIYIYLNNLPSVELPSKNDVVTVVVFVVVGPFRH